MSDALAMPARHEPADAHAGPEGAGLALLLAAAAAVALLTYSADDASLNNANLRDISNWLGPLGGGGGLLLQIFGLAALAFLAPFCSCGRARLPARPEICHVAPGGMAAGHRDHGGGPGPAAPSRGPAGRQRRHDRHRRHRPFRPCCTDMADPGAGLGLAAGPVDRGAAAGLPGHGPALYAHRTRDHEHSGGRGLAGRSGQEAQIQLRPSRR